jgi:ribulose-5-phosphate 4-epimerase/fuculose-1-phosphate aldolase
MALAGEALRALFDDEGVLRRDLAACYRLIARHGWDDMLATHMSVRLPGSDGLFLLNPYGLMFGHLKASDLIAVDSQGKVHGASNPGLNPAGLNIHAALHENHEGPLCVIHLHAVAGVALSTLECGLLPVSQTAMMIYHDVAYHDYEGFATHEQEREHLRRDLGDKSILILRNHGTLITAPTVAEAYARAVTLEKAADIQLKAMAAGQKMITPPADAITSLYKAASSETYAGHLRELLWPEMLRMLDAQDSSYRN